MRPTNLCCSTIFSAPISHFSTAQASIYFFALFPHPKPTTPIPNSNSTHANFHHLRSLAYNKWVPYLFDSTFNKSTALAGLNNVGPAYDEKYFEESLVINVMGGALVILAVVIPLIVSYPKFRYRPQRIVTVTHDRYG